MSVALPAVDLSPMPAEAHTPSLTFSRPQPPPPPPPTPTESGPGTSGRLAEVGLPSANRTVAVGMHISRLVLWLLGFGPFALLAPLILWLARKGESPFEDDHGREILNFGLSFLLWHVLTAMTVIGLILWPVLWVIAIVNTVRGAIAAGKGEYFRYPMTLRFLS